MKKKDIIRAWRDGEFYESLTDEQKASLPENPAALLALDDDVLNSVSGGCCSAMYPCPTSIVCSPCPPRHCP